MIAKGEGTCKLTQNCLKELNKEKISDQRARAFFVKDYVNIFTKLNVVL